MNNKIILTLVAGVAFIYSLVSLFQLDQAISEGGGLEQVQKRLLGYQISIWVSWVLLVVLAIYYKWTRKRNLFFTLTYGFLFVCFIIFGYYAQTFISLFQLPSSFRDTYTLGVFTAVQNIVMSSILTGFLQAAVWWFTKRR